MCKRWEWDQKHPQCKCQAIPELAGQDQQRLAVWEQVIWSGEALPARSQARADQTLQQVTNWDLLEGPSTGFLNQNYSWKVSQIPARGIGCTVDICHPDGLPDQK